MSATTDVVFLAPAGVSPPEAGSADAERLLAELRLQRVELGSTTVLQAPDLAVARLRLADLIWPVSAATSSTPAATPPSAAVSDPAAGTRVGGEPVEGSAIALLSAGLVVSSAPLGAVLDDPRVRTGALALDLPADSATTTDQISSVRRQLLGVVRIAGADRPAAAAVLRAPSASSTFSTFATRSADPAAGDLLLELVRGLEAAGVEVRPVPLGTGYAWAAPSGTDQIAAARAVLESVDERTVRLREAARGGDGFYSTFVLRKISWRFTDLAERLGLTPNQVTLLSFGLGLLAAGMLAVGDRPWSVAGALLLQFCLVVDCVDGELARYRRRFSRFGAWLDATTDRVKEFAAIGALALAGAGEVGGVGVGAELWWLVAAAIGVQTFRNLLDLGWSLQRTAGSRPPPVTTRWVPAQSWSSPPGPAPAGPGVLSWARRVGHFPIGERFLLISLGAAFWTPRGTLIALLAVGLLSTGYMLAAFVVRSRPSRGAGLQIGRLIDSGPVLGVLLRRATADWAGRFTAVLPALIAVSELALIQWLAIEVAGASVVAATTLVAVTAIAHYQHAYGVREDAAPATGGAAVFGIGTDLRLIALTLFAVVPTLVMSDSAANDWATAAIWALIVLVTFSSTARSLQSWTGSADPSAPPAAAGGSAPPRTQPGPGDPGRPGEPEETSMYRTVPADDGPEPAVRAVADRSTPDPATGGAR